MITEASRISHLDNFIEGLDKDRFLILYNLVKLNKQKIKNGIHFDLDEILSVSQDPVKKEFDRICGTDYCKYQIDRWFALATRAHNDGIMTFEEARKIEDQLWINPDILVQSQPNMLFRSYSKRAHELGIPQYVTTSRIPNLKDCTYAWLEKHFPWISNQNIAIQSKDYGLGGDNFKASRIQSIHPYAHFEDALRAVQSIRFLGLDTPVIWFPRKAERGSFANDPRLIEFSDEILFFGLFSENGMS